MNRSQSLYIYTEHSKEKQENVFIPSKPSSSVQRSIFIANQRIRAHSAPSRFPSLNSSRNNILSHSRNGSGGNISLSKSFSIKNGDQIQQIQQQQTVVLPTLVSESDVFFPDSPLGTPRVRTNTKKVAEITNDLKNLQRPAEFDDQTSTNISIPYNSRPMSEVIAERNGWIVLNSIDRVFLDAKQGLLNIYKTRQHKVFYYKTLKLKNFTLKNKDNEFTLVYNKQQVKEYHFSSCNQGYEKQDIEEWIHALLGMGCISETIVQYQKQKEMDKLEQLKQNEESYIQDERSKKKRSSALLDYQLVPDSLISRLDWSFELHKDVGDNSFSIKVSIDNDRYNWIIKRDIQQLNQIFIIFRKQLWKDQFSKDKSLLKLQYGSLNDLLNNFFDTIETNIADIFDIEENKKLRNYFIKFISPISWYDEKPINYINPFQIL
ncbi:hypothetical protein CYY_008946 [Polysphondylium violaceum]|uniref:Uncharacterized protein n=1 Tax=Polysphondylium violaceum TaxID=133409 RepID=A0A8J4UWN2_9MYCE|nr:hypothetical protein CYY_008946 [Polysphondylium violaceum]